MTRKLGNGIVIIQRESDSICEMCGALDECRPYGPKGESACFDCAMKDPEAAERKFNEFLDGSNQ